MADPTVTSLFGVPTTPVAQTPTSAPATLVAPAATPRYKEQDGKHQGVAGVARDIFGTLGDFLLTRLRMPAMYAPAQQRRKLAAAQEGYETDPLSAINRVTSVDPVFGAKLRDQYIDNQRLAAAQESTAEAKESRLGLVQQAQDQRTRAYAASMLGSMHTWDDAKRQQFYPQMREQVLNAARRQGIDLSAELPEAYDAIALDAFIDGAVPVGTQRTQRLARERIEATTRGQDIRSTDTRRGQDIRSTDTRRGQDINSGDRAAGRAVTVRGQDVRSIDTRRGQNSTTTGRRAGQAETTRHNRAMEARPGRFTPDPNRIYVQNGKRYRYNAQTRAYEPVK